MSRDQHATTWTVRTTGAEETRAVGAALGALLRAGDVVLLQGELGAGKTTLTQGLARGAGSDELVNSPTFILVNEYRGRVKIYHADLYRLEDPDEVWALDLPGATLDGALVVEWPERGADALPAEHLLVRILHVSPEERDLRFEPHGRRAENLVRELAAHAGSHRPVQPVSASRGQGGGTPPSAPPGRPDGAGDATSGR
jgi:tRNA threonylcarbamoyladenosine biosynthesis protein TsaE